MLNLSNSSFGLRDSVAPSSYNPPKILILPDDCFEKKTALTWGYGNKFTIFPRSQTTQKDAKNYENKLLQIRQEIIIFHPIIRQLVNESNGIYLNLKNFIESSKTSDNNLELLKASRHYRSTIRLCIKNLNECAEKETDGVESNNLRSYTTIFIAIECIWHLCEILFVESVPGDIVLPSLLEWLRFHFPSKEQEVLQLLENCERGSETHPEYWDALTAMIIQGHVDYARALLKLHSGADGNECKLLDHALKTMPLYNVYSGLSTGEFTISWKHWQAESRAKLSSGSLSAQPKLEFILRLIIGDYTAFESIRSKYKCWYDLLPSWVMYSCPWARRHELSEAAHACAGMSCATQPRNRLDLIVLALCEFDLHQVIHDIQNLSDNGWLATHLTDLLFHCGKLKIVDKHQNNVTTRLRESLILEYGSLLFEHRSLWNIGLSYLSGCGTEGTRRAELLLERVAVHTDRKALRVIAEARKYGMHGVAQSISSCRSAACSTAASALCWAVRARRPALAGQAAALVLQQYCRGKELPSDLLLTLGPSMLVNDTLLLAGKYCEFRQHYRSREFRAAADLLVNLLTSKIAPDFFWDTLLLDTLPLLESDEIIFGAQETFEILQALELQPNSLAPEQVDLLRLAATRNLARAALVSPEVQNKS